MCEKIEVPRISSWESVATFKIVLEEQICERMCEHIGVIEVLKISSQESVDAVKTFPSRPNFRKDV